MITFCDFIFFELATDNSFNSGGDVIVDKLPKLTIKMVDNDKYWFEGDVTKQIGELLIEIAEIDVSDIYKTIDKHECLDDELTEENLYEFSKWFLKELSNKYIYPIAFFITNMVIRAAIRYFNDNENYKNEINNYLNFVDDRLGNDLHIKIRIIQFKRYEESVREFANMAFFVSNLVFQKYQRFLYFLDYENKSDETDYILSDLVDLSTSEQDIEYKIILSKNNDFIDFYYIGDFLSFLIFDVRNAIRQKIIIKKCKNCDGYFIPQKRSDAIYCDRPSPQDKSLTCKEYGSRKLWYDRLRDNKSAKLYRNIYMAKQMLAKRNPDIQTHQDDFAEYKVQSAQWKKDVKTGLKTEEEYIAWLKSVSGRRYLD